MEEPRKVMIKITVVEHTVDFNRLLEYLNKTYCREYELEVKCKKHTLEKLEVPIIISYESQCSKCGKLKAN